MKNKLTISILTILLLPILLFACGNNAAPLEKGQVQTEQGSQKDAHTFSNTDQIRTKHLNLEIDVDFDKKTIYGVARHQMQRLKNTDTAIFDINGLEIQKVTLGKKGEENDPTHVKYALVCSRKGMITLRRKEGRKKGNQKSRKEK